MVVLITIHYIVGIGVSPNKIGGDRFDMTIAANPVTAKQTGLSAAFLTLETRGSGMGLRDGTDSSIGTRPS